MAIRRRLTSLKLSELSGVDRPCQEHATVAIMKRRDPVDADPNLTITKATFAEALAGQLIADRVRDVFWKAFENKWTADEAFRTALVDDLVAGGDGSAPSADYVAAVALMASAAVAAAREIGAKATDQELEAAVTKAIAEYVSTKQETTMTKLTTKALLLAAVAKFDPAKTTVAEVQEIQKAATDLDCVTDLPVALAPSQDGIELAKIKADLAKRDEIAAMSPDVRKHYDGLAEADQTAFLAKSEGDRNAVVADINKGDPVLYKTASGIEIRKSDGGAALALAKQSDDQAALIKSLTASSAEGALTKALALYPNVAKSLVQTMLKTKEAAGTDEEKADIDKALKAMNDANRGVFKQIGSGHSGGETGGDNEAASEMATIVKRIAKEHGITEFQATAKAAQEDARYKELYASAEPLVVDND